MISLDAKMKEIAEESRRVRGPIEAAARRLFSTPDGKKVMDALIKAYGSPRAARDARGAVDPYGTLIEVGRAEVVEFLTGLVAKEDEGGQG
jgi:hypothetical protein